MKYLFVLMLILNACYDYATPNTPREHREQVERAPYRNDPYGTPTPPETPSRGHR